jgi:beta-lactam-binding protein with PASTA domain
VANRHHAHSLEVKIAGVPRRARRWDRSTQGAAALGALVLGLLLAGVDDRPSSFALVITPSQLAFGAQPAGSLSALPLTLQNPGPTPIDLSARLTVSDPNFALDPGGCGTGQLAPGGTCVVSVVFQPRVAGAFAGTFRHASGGPLVSLSGAGRAAPVSTPPTPTPPAAPAASRPAAPEKPAPPAPSPQRPPAPVASARFVGSSFTLQADTDKATSVVVSLRNTGQTPIPALQLRFDGGHADDFSLKRGNCLALNVSAECQAIVAFEPKEAGTHEVTLLAEAGDVQLDQAHFTGIGQAPLKPRANVSPAHLQFSRTGESMTIVVQNLGTAPLQLGRFDLDNTNDFNVLAMACANQPVLAPNKACAIFVRFTGRRPATGALTVRHNDPPLATVVDLSAAVNPPTGKVPGVVGSNRDKAAQKITEKNFRVGTIRDEPSCEASGKVIAQNPQEGTTAPEGSAVDLTIASIGQDPATVPRVEKLPRAQAERLVRDARLSIAQRMPTRQIDSMPPGTVVSIRPDAGSRLAPNCEVTLTLAAPLPRISVPSYLGQTLAEAKRTLRTGFLSSFADFQLGNVTAADGAAIQDDTQWVVQSQNPPAGQEVPHQLGNGTVVDLTVARKASPTPAIMRNPRTIRPAVPKSTPPDQVVK